jgi:hypothetical protein
VAKCIAEHLQRFDASALPGADYALIVRVQPPTGKPVAPIEPPPNAPKFTPAAKPGAEDEKVLVSQLQDGLISEVQTALRLASDLCLPEPQPTCAPAVSKLRSHFASLGVGQRGRLVRFSANALGAGFDCVNIEPRAGFEHNTAVGVARPPQLSAAKWVLVSSAPLDLFPNPDTFTDDTGMRTEFVHLNDANTPELSLCVLLPDEQRSEWRLGVATYRNRENENWHHTDIMAFDLASGASQHSLPP